MYGNLCLILLSCTTMRNPFLSPWWPLVGTEGLLGAPKVISTPGWSSPAPPASAHMPRTPAPTALEPSKSSLQFSHVFPGLQGPKLNALSSGECHNERNNPFSLVCVSCPCSYTHELVAAFPAGHITCSCSACCLPPPRAAPQFHLFQEKSLDDALKLGPYLADVYLFHCVEWNTNCHPNMHSS